MINILRVQKYTFQADKTSTIIICLVLAHLVRFAPHQKNIMLIFSDFRNIYIFFVTN